MKCPKCGGKSTVKDTLHTEESETYRRLKCLNESCGQTFYTIEYEVEYNEALRKELFKCDRQRRSIERVDALYTERRKK